MSCSDEAHPHTHNGGQHAGHDHHGHGHGHDHSHDSPLGSGPKDNLYAQIDLPNVESFNSVGGNRSGMNVIKPWEEREDETKFCESDVDGELLISIPLTASCLIRSITLKAGPSGQTPNAMHVFTNTPYMSLHDAERQQPVQVFDVVQTREGTEYQTRYTKFLNTTHLHLYFPDSQGDPTTKVFYIGLKGQHRPLPKKPEALGPIVYETLPQRPLHRDPATMETAAWGF